MAFNIVMGLTMVVLSWMVRGKREMFVITAVYFVGVLVGIHGLLGFL